MYRHVILFAFLCLACPPKGEFSDNLGLEVRKSLAERDRKLSSYRVEATTRQGEATAKHVFAYRTPGRVKGTASTPTAVTLSFDGMRFYRLSASEKKLEVFEMKLPAEKAALFLTSQFSPFVPEGYRTPLIPSRGVTVKRVAHRKGPEAFEVSHSTATDDGPVSVTYFLRYPSADFLAKRTQIKDRVSEVSVEEEQCDSKLGLCVPQVVVEREGNGEVGRTTFTRIELLAEIPNDSFSVVAPPEFSTEKHELVESDAR